MSDIYTRTPANKSSALVVSQKGCTSHNGFSESQQRDIWVAKNKQLKNILGGMDKRNPLRPEIVKEYQENQEKLSSVKRNGYRNLQSYIIEVLKKRCTKHQWEMIVEKAKELKDSE